MPRKIIRKKRRGQVVSRTWAIVIGLLMLTGALLYWQFPGIGNYLKGQAFNFYLGGVFIAAGDVTGDGIADYITGADAGGGPHVKVWDGARTDGWTGASNSENIYSFFAYHPDFRGGVRVAAGDITRDGRADIITAAGPGGGPHVKVFDATNGVEIRSFYAYDPVFAGGVYAAAGDLNGDGVADIITGAGFGGGPHVKAFDGATGALLRSFYAYNPLFIGGVRVAAGDVNRDGIAEIITTPGPGGPHVKIFDGRTNGVVREWFAYDPAFQGGVFVAAGDVTGDGVTDIVTGADAGGGPHVKVWDGVSNAVVHSYYAYAPAFSGGVRVAAADVNRDGRADLVSAAGPGGGPHVRTVNGVNLADLRGFMAYTSRVPTPTPPPPAFLPPAPCYGESCGAPPRSQPSPQPPTRQPQPTPSVCVPNGQGVYGQGPYLNCTAQCYQQLQVCLSGGPRLDGRGPNPACQPTYQACLQQCAANRDNCTTSATAPQPPVTQPQPAPPAPQPTPPQVPPVVGQLQTLCHFVQQSCASGDQHLCSAYNSYCQPL